MTLYLVVIDDCDGNNKDCFVRADTPKQAIAFAMWNWRLPRREMMDAARVFEVPTVDGPKGALPWRCLALSTDTAPRVPADQGGTIAP